MITALESRIRALFAQDADADAAEAIPLYPVRSNALEEDLAETPAAVRAWAETIGFTGRPGAFAFAPASTAGGGEEGGGEGVDGGVAQGVAGALFGAGDKRLDARLGAVPTSAPPRLYALAGRAIEANKAALAWALGAYRFTRYSGSGRTPARLVARDADLDRVTAIAAGAWLARDLVNTPANDLGPSALEAAARALAERHGATMTTTQGDALLERNYPMIHAVGRAGPEEPRLIDIIWSPPDLPADAPKITLVGKGVCFDTGGLDIKPPRFMRNMKKDMGGAAAALGLAHMIMARALPVRLRVLIPAVENSVGSVAFRPGDVLTSRAGLTVEIGDTDAEGRLVLADALTEADQESPTLLVDFATLTGAARVALGPEVAPFYTGSEALAAEIAEAGARAEDPVWRLPLWEGYEGDLASKVADMSNVSTSGYAGSITAALFLKRFVDQAEAWAHFDIFAWNPKTTPGRPEGGELSGGRAMFELLERRYGRSG